MSKYLYVIIPVVLMALFIGVYIVESNSMEKEHAAKVAADKAKAEEEARNLEKLREKSAADAKRVAEERAAADKAKEDAKKAAYEEGLKKLKDEAALYIADQNKYKAQIADLQNQLDKLRADKETLSRQSIGMNQTIVASLIDRQNAETEVQRFAAMVARRASDSPLARPPAIVTPGQ